MNAQAQTLSPRWLRLLKHRRWDETDARRTLPAAALQRLGARVAASEQGHSGEIRLCIEAGLPLSYLWKRLSARHRAVMLFGKLGVWDTAANNGVLVYLLLAERAIEVVADRGITARVPAAEWQAIVNRMQPAFRQGAFEDGLAQAVAELDRLLRQHFPLAEGRDNPNELPDAPVLLL